MRSILSAIVVAFAFWVLALILYTLRVGGFETGPTSAGFWRSLTDQPVGVHVAGLAMGAALALVINARAWRRRPSGTSSTTLGPHSQTATPDVKPELTSIQRAFPSITIPPFKRGVICKVLDVATLGIAQFYMVPEGFILVVMAFERYRTFRTPGLSPILSFWGLFHQPWIHLVPTQEQVEKYEVHGATTSDGVHCDINGILSYKIVDAERVIFHVMDFSAIEEVAKGLVRDECGKRPARDLLKARSDMSQAAKTSLSSDAGRWGLEIPIFDVLEIKFHGSDRHPTAQAVS